MGLFRIITTIFITNQRPDFVMNEKKGNNSTFHMQAITFLMIGIIIVTGIYYLLAH